MSPPSWWREAAQVFVDPVGAIHAAAARPRPEAVASLLAVVLVVLGAATIPRQLHYLNALLPIPPDPVLAGPQAALRAGLVNLIVSDRLVPAPTLLITALLVGACGQSVLALATDRRRAVWAVVILGLTPLAIERMGELAVTYLTSPDAVSRPGDAIKLPHRFLSGPLLFWTGAESPPGWLVSLDQKLDLVTVWCLTLWTLGLRELDRASLAAWQLWLPVGCLAIAAAFTWAATPYVIGVILRLG